MYSFALDFLGSQTMLNKLLMAVFLCGLGFLIGAILLNVYFAIWATVGIFALGITSDAVNDVAYWICLTIGFFTSAFLMLKVWRTSFPGPKTSESDA